MNPLLIGVLAFIGIATLVGGVALLMSKPPSSRLEDRLDLLTGAASPSNKDLAIKDNSVLSRPLDDAPGMLAQWFEKLANFDLLFEQADTTLTVGKLAAFSVVLGLAGCAVAIAMKSPVAIVPLAAFAAGSLPCSGSSGGESDD